MKAQSLLPVSQSNSHDNSLICEAHRQNGEITDMWTIITGDLYISSACVMMRVCVCVSETGQTTLSFVSVFPTMKCVVCPAGTWQEHVPATRLFRAAVSWVTDPNNFHRATMEFYILNLRMINKAGFFFYRILREVKYFEGHVNSWNKKGNLSQ